MINKNLVHWKTLKLLTFLLLFITVTTKRTFDINYDSYVLLQRNSKYIRAINVLSIKLLINKIITGWLSIGVDI